MLSSERLRLATLRLTPQQKGNSRAHRARLFNFSDLSDYFAGSAGFAPSVGAGAGAGVVVAGVAVVVLGAGVAGAAGASCAKAGAAAARTVAATAAVRRLFMCQLLRNTRYAMNPAMICRISDWCGPMRTFRAYFVTISGQQ